MAEPSSDSEENPLEFNLFGDLLDDIDHENEKIAKKEASKKEREDLLIFIGGFEFWPLLNEDCRKEIVKYLDYKERCKLGICSKADYATVDKTPISVHTVEIFDNERSYFWFSNEEVDSVVVKVQFQHDYNSGRNLEFVFSQLEEDTQIQWVQYYPKKGPEKRQLIWKSCNYYEESVKFAEKWMKKCNYELKSIKVEMSKYPFETSQIKKLPECKRVRIGANDVESFNWWLEKVPEQLDDLQLITDYGQRETFTLPSEFLNKPQIMEVPQFYFWCRAAFTDNQFLNLKAKSISFDCVDVTDDGINQFIKKWINGKCVPDFKQVILWSQVPRSQEVLTRGLELRPWNEDFEDEAAGFCFDFGRCCGRGTTFQIKSKVDPYESVTLDISDDRVSIYHTGNRYEYNGEAYTGYSIP